METNSTDWSVDYVDAATALNMFWPPALIRRLIKEPIS